MNAADWKRYNAMTAEERAAFEQRLWEEFKASNEQANEGDFLANARGGAAGSGDFLAGARNGSTSEDFLASSQESPHEGDFLSKAKNEREAKRRVERERLARIERRRWEGARRDRARDLAASRYDSVPVTSSNLDQLKIIATEQEATAPQPEAGHNYYLIGYWYCIYTGFDRGGEQRRTYSNIGRWDVTYRWIGIQAGRAMLTLMPNPEIWDRPPPGFDNSACYPEWVVVERRDGDRALRRMTNKWLNEISANRRVYRVHVAKVQKWGRLKHPVER